MRLALVHEFRTRSKVLICTEAGAKGLNLQFCETVINYDLPWNPQRIEQRIGRCHRYSQQRDVTVINFIAEDNEAHSLTFEILSQKLDLFGKVLDASDIVLHEPRTDAPEIAVSALVGRVREAICGASTAGRARSTRSRARSPRCATRSPARRDAYEKEYERTSQSKTERAAAARHGHLRIAIKLGEAIADWSALGGYELEGHWDASCRRIVRASFDEIAERPARTLSGGERKQLVLDVLFASDADVLLLDEPDNFLDIPAKLELEQRIRVVQEDDRDDLPRPRGPGRARSARS